jgi:ribonuclease D
VSDPAFQVVDRHEALRDACARLADAQRVYLDTEFEARRDGARLCLVQLTAGETIYLIDTLRLHAREPLARLLGAAHVQWVLHAGAQDVPLLLRELELGAPPQLFDTQVAWALLSPEYSVSLAYLQFRVLGIRAAKAHQSDDWQRRPLPQRQLAYAAADVEHLPELRARLGEAATRLGREHLVAEVSQELLWPEPEATPQLSLESFRNAWLLDRESQAGLRFAIDWYNGLSDEERADAPEPKVLLSIANRLPENADDLSRIKGVPRRWCARHGDHFTGRLIRAAERASSDHFVPIDPPPYATFQDIRLDAWLQTVRAEVCAAVQVAPELAFPARLLRPARAAIRERRDACALLDFLGGWRRELLADAYLAQCRRTPLPPADT